MRRTCERPGCAEPASVAYGMVPEHLLVWLEACDPSQVAEPRPGLLCQRHADAMVVPVGWTLDDRREAMPPLFRTPRARATTREVTGPPRRRRRRAAQTLELFDTSPPQEPLRPTALAEPTAWIPRFDPDDDLGGLLAAKSPLLARAFRSVAHSGR